MRIYFEAKFKIGDEVALRVDPITRRIVTGYTKRQKALTYILAGPDLQESWHQECEIDRLIVTGKKAGFK